MFKKFAQGKSMHYSNECKGDGTTQQMIQHMQKFHPLLPIILFNLIGRVQQQSHKPLFKEKWTVLKCLQFTKKMNF